VQAIGGALLGKRLDAETDLQAFPEGPVARIRALLNTTTAAIS